MYFNSTTRPSSPELAVTFEQPYQGQLVTIHDPAADLYVTAHRISLATFEVENTGQQMKPTTYFEFAAQ